MVALCMMGSGLAHAEPAAASTPGKKGLTLGLYSHDPVLGIDYIGHNSIGDPYNGDTICTAKRPVLCIKNDGSPRPNYDVEPGQEFYQGWVEGHFATTKPVAGNILGGVAGGDAQCVANFGPGWRMAEWHDGMYVPGMNATQLGNTIGSLSPWPSGPKAHGGHSMRGYGNVRSDKRYWVYINNQPGNCWN